MRDWRPELFTSSALIPSISVSSSHMEKVRKILEKYLLKMRNVKPVQQCQKFPERKSVLLSPEQVSSFRDLEPLHSSLEEYHVNHEHFRESLNCCYRDTVLLMMNLYTLYISVLGLISNCLLLSVRIESLTVENWTPGDILKAILPVGEEGVSGFSSIGHIVHLNLRDHHEPYKAVIGQALLQLPTAKTVINKSNTIDNTYRNFSLELLAGEEDYEVTVKESGCVFSLDFSKVYWNPRLATEHDRIIRMIREEERPVLFDACAGVGPFSVPCGKFCQVFCNDLNPESFKWLEHNVKNNKKSSKNTKTFNLDAREFIREIVKEKLLEIWSSNTAQISSAHIVMNLPALAITFVDVFNGLFADQQDYREKAVILPAVHVYCFSKAENTREDVIRTCEKHLGHVLDETHLLGVHFVRNVAPSKDMMRIDFTPPKVALFHQEYNGAKRHSTPDSDIEPSNKK